jgi:hypothetical protein
MRRWVGATVLWAVLAGCSDSPQPTVASADRTTGPTASASVPPASPGLPQAEQGIRYARCMTAHGVPVPDPVDGAYPHAQWADGVTVDPAARLTAYPACRKLFPSITYSRVPPDYIEPYRKYSACMRKQGITEGLVDPDDQGLMAATNQIATTTGSPDDPTGTPEYMAAYLQCQHLLPPEERNGGGGGT